MPGVVSRGEDGRLASSGGRTTGPTSTAATRRRSTVDLKPRVGVDDGARPRRLGRRDEPRTRQRFPASSILFSQVHRGQRQRGGVGHQVRAGHQDLRRAIRTTLESLADSIVEVLKQVPGAAGRRRRASVGPAAGADRRRPRRDRALGLTRGGRPVDHRDRVRRRGGDAGARRASGPSIWSSKLTPGARVRSRRDPQDPGVRPERRAAHARDRGVGRGAPGFSRIYREENARRIAVKLSVPRPRPGLAGRRGAAKGRRSRSSCRRATVSSGPARSRTSSAPCGGWRWSCRSRCSPSSSCFSPRSTRPLRDADPAQRALRRRSAACSRCRSRD